MKQGCLVNPGHREGGPCLQRISLVPELLFSSQAPQESNAPAFWLFTKPRNLPVLTDAPILKDSSFPFTFALQIIPSARSGQCPYPPSSLPLISPVLESPRLPLAQLNPWEPAPDLGTLSRHHTSYSRLSPQHLSPLCSLLDPPNSHLCKEKKEKKTLHAIPVLQESSY